MQFVSCYISSQGYYISMQLIGWSFCYISSHALLHFYAAFLLHFYASFITFLCRYYISMQGCYISMQVITFLAFITFLCPTRPLSPKPCGLSLGNFSSFQLLFCKRPPQEGVDSRIHERNFSFSRIHERKKTFSRIHEPFFGIFANLRQTLDSLN